MDTDKNKVEEVAQILGLKPKDIRGWRRLKGKKLSNIQDNEPGTSNNHKADNLTRSSDVNEQSGRENIDCKKKHADLSLEKTASGKIDVKKPFRKFYDNTFKIKNIMKKGRQEILEDTDREKEFDKQHPHVQEQDQYWEEFGSRVVLISKSISLGMPEDEFVERLKQDDVYLKDFNRFLELLLELTPDKSMIRLLIDIYNT